MQQKYDYFINTHQGKFKRFLGEIWESQGIFPLVCGNSNVLIESLCNFSSETFYLELRRRRTGHGEHIRSRCRRYQNVRQ